MTRMAFPRKKITARVMAMTTIRVAMSTSFLNYWRFTAVHTVVGSRQDAVLGIDNGDGAVDLIDLNLGALLDHQVRQVRPGGPALAVHLDLAARPVDLGHR